MTLKCKIASESECGKDCCCYDCLDAKDCKVKCPTFEEFDKRVLDECEELEKVEEEIVTLDQKVPDVIKAITDIVTQKKALDEQEKMMREKLQAAMEQHNIKSFSNELIKVTYVAPTTRTSIDSAKLKKEHPEIAEAYQKISNVKASVKIEVK